MKNSTSILFVLALAAGAHGATTEWVGTANGADAGALIMSGGQLQNVSHWSNGVPDGTTDVIVRQNWTRAMGAGTLQMKSLEVKGDFQFLTLSADEENAVRNGTYNQADYKAPTLIIGDGGLSFSGDGNLNIGSVEYRYGFEKVVVGGDIAFNNMGRLQICYNPNSTYGTDNWSLDVGGVVRMNGDTGTQRFAVNKCGNGNYEGPNPTATVDAYVRLGGIDGRGYMYSHDPGATSTNIYFQAQDGKAFQGGRWSGFIGKYNMGDTPVGINLVMDGGEGGGKQYLRLTSPDNEENLALDKLTLTVKSGHIGVSNPGERFDSVTLEGGTLEIDLKSDYDPSVNYMDVFYADSLEIKGESRILLSAAPNSEITAFDVLNVFGDGRVELVIDLLPEFFSVGDSLEENLQTLLIAKFKDVLSKEISDVKFTNRLNKSPVALVAGEGQMSIHLERLMKQHGQTQAFASSRTLELNPRHPVIKKLATAVFEKKEESKVTDAIWVLYDQARAIEGEPLRDPAGFAAKINSFLENGL